MHILNHPGPGDADTLERLVDLQMQVEELEEQLPTLQRVRLAAKAYLDEVDHPVPHPKIQLHLKHELREALRSVLE